MKLRLKSSLLSLSMATLAPCWANATVLDFQDPSIEVLTENFDNTSHDYRTQTLTVDGFSFHSGFFDVIGPTVGPDGNRFMNPDNSDRGPRHYSPTIDMTRADGGLFDLLSIDFASGRQYSHAAFDSPWVLDVVVMGWSSTGFQEVHVTVNPGAFQTFDLGLHGITQAEWAVAGYTVVDDPREDQFTMGLPFDNVVANAVPEPGRWALMSFGLGLLGLATRRRNTQPKG